MEYCVMCAGEGRGERERERDNGWQRLRLALLTSGTIGCGRAQGTQLQIQ